MRDDKPPRWIRKVLLNPDSMASMMKTDRFDENWTRFCKRVYMVRMPHWTDRTVEFRVRYKGEYKNECLSRERTPDFIVHTGAEKSAFEGFMKLMYQQFLQGDLPVVRNDTHDDLS